MVTTPQSPPTESGPGIQTGPFVNPGTAAEARGPRQEPTFGATHPTSRLHRSATDRIVAGVCGGIAEYLTVDPSLVRLAFVVATLWGGIGLLLYVILAIILPVEDRAPSYAPAPFSVERTHAMAGVVLVVLGGVLLAGNLGLAPWLSWNLFWPGVLILVGVALLLRTPHAGTGT